MRQENIRSPEPAAHPPRESTSEARIPSHARRRQGPAGEGTNPEASRALRPHALPGRQPPGILCTCVCWAGRGFPALASSAPARVLWTKSGRESALRPRPTRGASGPPAPHLHPRLTCLPLAPIAGSPRGASGDRRTAPRG